MPTVVYIETFFTVLYILWLLCSFLPPCNLIDAYRNSVAYLCCMYCTLCPEKEATVFSA